MSKLSDQISVRMDPEWRELLRQIETQHRIPPPDFIRGMVAAGLSFYREHGWIAFPLQVRPARQYVDAVSEARRLFDDTSPEGDEAPQPLPEGSPKSHPEPHPEPRAIARPMGRPDTGRARIRRGGRPD